MNYIDKINNHIKLDFNDLKSFCLDQINVLNLQGYVNNLEIDNMLFGVANYSKENKKICLSDDFKEIFKYFKKENLSSDIINKFLCNYNDLYNLFVIEIIFHELWHARQEKELNENKNSNYSILINASNQFMNRSGSTYNYFHDRYYHEYDAIINSILLTLDFIKIFNLDERALYIINKNFASEILNSYGVNEKKDLKNEYDSPLNFLEFLCNYLNYNEETITLKKISKLIITIQNFDTEFDNLIIGSKIPTNIIEKLKSIKDGKYRTTDIIKEIDSELKNCKRL